MGTGKDYGVREFSFGFFFLFCSFNLLGVFVVFYFHYFSLKGILGI